MSDEVVKSKGGAPRGNTNGIQSGLYALMRLRKSGKPNGRTAFGKAFFKRESEYTLMYGGDPSPAERTLIMDTVWCDFYVAAIDLDLAGKKLNRRGKPHPLIDIRVRLASHRRENLKSLGLRRVQKLVDWRETLREE